MKNFLLILVCGFGLISLSACDAHSVRMSLQGVVDTAKQGGFFDPSLVWNDVPSEGQDTTIEGEEMPSSSIHAGLETIPEGRYRAYRYVFSDDPKLPYGAERNALLANYMHNIGAQCAGFRYGERTKLNDRCLKQIFDAVDTNDTGKVGPEELYDGMVAAATLDALVRNGQVDEEGLADFSELFMTFFDKDRSHSLTLLEFKKFAIRQERFDNLVRLYGQPVPFLTKILSLEGMARPILYVSQ